MIQAIGLTSAPRGDLPPAVDDLTFEARPGHVTALVGAPGSGKSTTLHLMLELRPGRGVTYFRGRPLHRVAHPAREVGVLLGDVPGHPGRTVRGQLRMLCAASGVQASRADDVLDLVGLTGLGEHRLGTLSLGMDRRLGLACALLGDPHTVVLDAPTAGLSPREADRFHELLRGRAAQGGVVLYTTSDAKEAARTADQVVSIQDGRLVADQRAADFARTRLRPRVAVRTPHAARLGALLAQEARAAQRSVEVVAERGGRLSVYGSSCADIGETAFRHGILVHGLADEVGDPNPAATGGKPDRTPPAQGPVPVQGPARARAQGQAPLPEPLPAASPAPDRPRPLPRDADLRPAGPAATGSAATAHPPRPALRARPSRLPLRPLRYELRRATGIPARYAVVAVVAAVSVLISVLLARAGHASPARTLTAWPNGLPLPPAAVGAGLLGALAFSDEYRYPALAAQRGGVPRRLGLLAAKLAVAAATGLLLAVVTVLADGAVLRLVYGPPVVQVPGDWRVPAASWAALMIGCAWAGLLAAGIFRTWVAGLVTVATVPLLVVPVVHKVLREPAVHTAAGLPGRLHHLTVVRWPAEADRMLIAGLRMIAQPVGAALALSLTVLLCAYLVTVIGNGGFSVRRWRELSPAARKEPISLH